MTNEEILEKLNHKDGLIKTVEIHKAMEAARKDEADRLRENCSANHVNIDDLLTAFNNAGFDTSNWDGEEGAEQALVDGVKNEIDRLRGEVERLTMDNMTHEFNQAEAEKFAPEYERQIREDEANKWREQVRKLREGLEAVLKEYEYSCKLMAEANGMFWSENNVSISAKQLLTETEG